MILAQDASESLQNIKDTIDNTDSTKLHKYLNQAIDWIVAKGTVILLTLLFLYIGSKIIKLILKLLRKSFDKSQLSPSVSGFLVSLIRIVMYSILVITAASLMGFQVTSLVTILGSASIAIGLALQGGLSNLAGGVLILILHPFVVGDYIMENDKKCEGTVISIEIFYTRLRTPDNKIIVIPNGSLSSTSVVNFTAQKIRRVDISVGVSYSTDIKKAKDILLDLARECQYTDKAEEINVFVDNFGDSSINMGLRFWVASENYWISKWTVTENIKTAFDDAEIEIPFNQLEIAIKNNN